MKFGELLQVVGNEPVFSSSLLLTHGRNPSDMRRQLSRWVSDGRLEQLKRSLYLLADPYRKCIAHPFLLANRIKDASYISLQSALAHYGLIPEYVPVVTSVTTGRPEKLSTAAGTFVFKHIKKSFFSGYVCVELANHQSAFIASPEKALLDLIYLTPGADDEAYLFGLRIQHSERLDMERLAAMAVASGSTKLIRAVERLSGLLKKEDYFEL